MTTKENDNEELTKQLIDTVNDLRVFNERQTKISSDDQIFLATILAFITILVSIQFGDIADFFKLANSPTHYFSAMVFTAVGLLTLAFAVFFRYWATLTDDSKTKFIGFRSKKVEYSSFELRYGSLEAFFIGFEFMVIVVTINLVAYYQDFYFENLMLFIVVLVIVFLEQIENKILSVYKFRQFIAKDAEPLASIAFSCIAVFVGILVLSFVLTYNMTFLSRGAVVLLPEQFQLVDFQLLTFIKILTALWMATLFFAYRKALQKLVSIMLKEKDNRKKRRQQKSYESFLTPIR